MHILLLLGIVVGIPAGLIVLLVVLGIIFDFFDLFSRRYRVSKD